MWNSKLLLSLVCEFSANSIKLLALALVAVCSALFLSDLHFVSGNLHLFAFVPFETQISLLRTSEAALRPLTICIALGIAFLLQNRSARETSLGWYTTWMTQVFGLRRPERLLPFFTVVAVCFFWFSFMVAGYSLLYGGGGAVSNLSTRYGFFKLGEVIHKEIRERSAVDFGHSSCLQIAYGCDISGEVGDRIECAIAEVYGSESLELARIVELRGSDYFTWHRDYKNAEVEYAKALKLYRHNESLSGICDTLGEIADVQERQKKSAEAKTNLVTAIDMVISGSVTNPYALSLKSEVAAKLGVVQQFDKAMSVGRERMAFRRIKLDPLVRYGNIINNALIALVFLTTFIWRTFVYWCLENRVRKAFQTFQGTNVFSVYFDSLADIIDLERLRQNMNSAEQSSRLLLKAAESQTIMKDDKLVFVSAPWKKIFTLRQFVSPACVVLLGFIFLQFRYY